MTLDQFLIDKRVVERNIKSGKVDGAQYQKQLDGLPDLSGAVVRHSEDPAPQTPASEVARSSATRTEASELTKAPHL
ncbi:MAG: hypothetical protein ACHQ53_01750 [Polyangiales bacterium]